MSINPFTQRKYYLGTSTLTGVGKEDVDAAFRYPDDGVSHPCIYCGNAAILRIIPKKEKYNTAEIQNEGYMCEHCTRQGYLDKNKYGVRPLK